MKMRDFVQPETAAVAAVNEEISDGKGWTLLHRQGRAPATTAFAATLLVILALLAGCNSSTPNTPPAKPEIKPPELLTGRSAFYKTFIAARNYAADVKPFRIESTPSSESNGQDGKSAIWRSSNASTQVFDAAFLKVDTDQAFTEAQKHGGDKILEKDPSTPVIYICEWNHNTNQLVWHVIYGTSRETAKLAIAIDASSGAFIREEK
jgi:hypothetical protein